MQKLIRVSINETGGEFTCGTIESDQGDLIEEIKNKIDDGDMSSYCELESGDDFDAVMYDNKFHIYGPNVTGSSVTIEEADIPENKNENDLKESDFKLIFEGPIEESGIHVFESSNPGYPELEEGEITIFTKKYEIEHKIENRPEFDGRFFVKIFRDESLSKYILTQGTEDIFYKIIDTWQVRYLNNNGYKGGPSTGPITVDYRQARKSEGGGLSGKNHPTEYSHHHTGSPAAAYSWGGTNGSRFGLDDDDKDVFKHTVEWGVKNGITTSTYHILTPYPGTKLFQDMEQAGRITSRNWDLYDTRNVVYQTKSMSAQELKQGYDWAYQSFYSWKNIIRASMHHHHIKHQLKHLVVFYKQKNQQIIMIFSLYVRSIYFLGLH